MLPRTSPILILILAIAHVARGQFVDQPPVTIGIDLCLETSAGLSGGATTGQAMHGSALAHLTWNIIPGDDRPAPLSAYVSALSIVGDGPTGRFSWE